MMTIFPRLIFTLFTVVVFSNNAIAKMEIFGGGGLSIGTFHAQVDDVSSQFKLFNYVAEAGIALKFGGYGIMGGAEYGMSDAWNNTTEESYLEKATNEFTSLKAGLSYGKLTLGYGMRTWDLTITSVSDQNGEVETQYEGNLPFYFAAFSAMNVVGGNDLFRTTVEIQKHAGDLGDSNIDETTVTIKILMMLDPK